MLVLTVLAVGTIVFSRTHTCVLSCQVLTHSPILAGLTVTLIHIYMSRYSRMYRDSY